MDELMQDREWGEKEMGLRTESWRTLTVVGAEEQKREGIQEEMEFPERWEWFPYLLPLFQCYSPSLLKRCVGGGTCPAPECSQVKSSRASDWSVWVLELVEPGRCGRGTALPTLPGCVTSDEPHPCDLQPFLHLPEDHNRTSFIGLLRLLRGIMCVMHLAALGLASPQSSINGGCRYYDYYRAGIGFWRYLTGPRSPRSPQELARKGAWQPGLAGPAPGVLGPLQ